MGLPAAAAGDLKAAGDGALQGADGASDAAVPAPDGARPEASSSSSPGSSSTGPVSDAAQPADEAVGDGGADGAGPPDATLLQAGDAESWAEAAVVVADSSTGPTPPLSCFVTFTVADAFVDGVIDTGVAMGGDTIALGSWDPNAAVSMTSIGAGAYTLSLLMNDGDEVQFLFVKRGSASSMWEDWGVNSNRSLVVSCTPGADAGALVDGGPVVGTSYAGEFGVRPPDAT